MATWLEPGGRPQDAMDSAVVHRWGEGLSAGARGSEAAGMVDFPAPVRDLLRRQEGLVTRPQLLGHGVTKEAVRWNAGRSWRVVLPSVYLLGRDTPTTRQRDIAALLWAGPTAVIGGASAARLHGITSADPGGLVHLDVPAPGASRRRGFAVARRTLIEEHHVVRRGPLRLCSAARAAVDAARTAPTDDDRSAILIEAVQRGLADLDDLAEWVFRLRTRDAARLHDAVAAASTGAWSLPELLVLEVMSESPLLRGAMANPALATADGRVLTTPDVWLDDVAMAVMVHSRRYHASGEEWDATVEKDSDLVGAGVVVVGVTPNRIRRDPGAVRARLEAAHLAARARPRPPVVATPRHLVVPVRRRTA